MDLKKIKGLIDLLNESPLAEIELIEGADKVHLIKSIRQDRPAGFANSTPSAAVSASRAAPAAAEAFDLAPSASSAGLPDATPTHTAEQIVRAPMFGVVHLTPAPAQPPFVAIEERVESGQVLCTIEAMKMFNSIESEWGGRVAEILVTSGSEVDVGQALFRIE